MAGRFAGLVSVKPSKVEADPYDAVRQQAVESFKEEFRDLSDTWKTLDTKAQGLGALAGIFIAGVFAWVRDADKLGTAESLFLIATILYLAETILFALATLRTKVVSSTPLGTHFAGMVDNILELDDRENAQERISALYNDLSRDWRKTNEEMRTAISAKANTIMCGQATLAVAAALALLLTICAITSKGFNQ